MSQRTTTHGAATLAAGILASRILGFARDMLLAFLLGPGADPFLVAFRVPNFFRRLLAEGSLGMAHGAEVSRRLISQGRAAALEFSRAVCLRLFLLCLPVTVLLAVCAFPLAFLLAPGLAAQPQALEKSSLILRLCLPYLPLCAASAIAFAHATALNNFRPQAWSPLFLNSLILLAGGLALLLYPGGAPAILGSGLTGTELLLCLGIVCGGLAQAVIGLRCLRRPETADDGKNAVSTADVSALLRRLPASALGAAPQQIHLLAGTILASFLAPGGISSLYFAERLFELPHGLAGVAVGLAFLPRLSAQAARSDLGDFSRTLSDGLRLSAFLSLPATAGLFALSLPLADLLFGHGAFDPEQVACTAAALRVYALGLPAICAARPLLAAVSALGQERVPLHTACLSLALLLPVSLAGMRLFGSTPAGAAAGLALGLSAGSWANAVLLLRHLRASGIACPVRNAARPLAAYTAAALLMTGALSAASGHGPLSASLLLLLIGACAGLWLGCFYALNNIDARSLFGLLRGSGRRAGKTGS